MRQVRKGYGCQGVVVLRKETKEGRDRGREGVCLVILDSAQVRPRGKETRSRDLGAGLVGV